MLVIMGKLPLWQLPQSVSSLVPLFLVSLVLPLGLHAALYQPENASTDETLGNLVAPSSPASLMESPPFESSLNLDDDIAVTNILKRHPGSSPVASPFPHTKFEEGLTIHASTVRQLMKSVLRLHVVKVVPDFGKAWTNKGETRSTGSGFPVSKRRIITNAHVTTHAHLIRIEVPGSPKLFDARIISMVHEPDLCVLTVDDEKFWENLTPLEIVKEIPRADSKTVNTSTIPNLLDGVYVAGYPTGGDSISVTQGIVSRVEVGFYSHSFAYLIEIQIDAAINPGNSGGPVVNEKGRVVGVAFQGLANADSIGYIIPAPVITHVLEDIKKHGKYTGIVSLGILIQSLRNPMLKSYLGINNPDVDAQLPEGVENNGIVVTKVDERRLENYFKDVPDADMSKIGFKEEDVILAIDGKNVAEDGSISFRNVERVDMNYLLINKYAGDLISATVLRNNMVVNLQIPLDVPQYVVPSHANGSKPRYLLFGGAVIVPLTKEYILDFKDASNRLALSTKVDGYRKMFRTNDLEEAVVISRILSSKYMKGYNVENQQISEVNGVKIRSLTHLAELLGMIDEDGKPVDGLLLKPESSTRLNDTKNEGADSILYLMTVASQLEFFLKKAVKSDDAVKVIEAVDTKDAESVKPEFVKFGFTENKFNLVIEKHIALVANQELMKFHNINHPFYLGDENKT